MYQKSGPHHDDVLLHLRHEYVQGNLQLQVEGGDNCAEIYVTRNAERIRAIRELNKPNIQPFHYQNMNGESTNLSI